MVIHAENNVRECGVGFIVDSTSSKAVTVLTAQTKKQDILQDILKEKKQDISQDFGRRFQYICYALLYLGSILHCVPKTCDHVFDGKLN